MARKARGVKMGRGLPTAGIVWLAGLALLVLAGVGLWIVAQPPAESGSGTLGPRLAVNQDRLDLGRLPFNQMARAEFTLTNQGDRTLRLDASAPVRVLEGC